jgi:hypothetical protein
MRALCGAIIAAGALIGLGFAAVGVGTRYAWYHNTPPVTTGDIPYVKFTQMDSTLIGIIVLLVIAAGVGIVLAFIGLAYHHHRRHHEMFGHRDTSGTRIPVNQP